MHNIYIVVCPCGTGCNGVYYRYGKSHCDPVNGSGYLYNILI